MKTSEFNANNTGFTCSTSKTAKAKPSNKGFAVVSLLKLVVAVFVAVEVVRNTGLINVVMGQGMDIITKAYLFFFSACLIWGTLYVIYSKEGKNK